MTDITQWTKEWKLSNSLWDRYVQRSTKNVTLKKNYQLIKTSYGNGHDLYEIVDNGAKKQVAFVNTKHNLYQSFCVISIENQQGNRVLI